MKYIFIYPMLLVVTASCSAQLSHCVFDYPLFEESGMLPVRRSSDIEFKHEIGLFYTYFLSDNDSVSSRVGNYGVNYTPRLNYELSKKQSVSLDLPFNLGASFQQDAFGSSQGVLSIEFPLKVSYNYGLGANTKDDFGVFAGVGYGGGLYFFTSTWAGGDGFGSGFYADIGCRFETDTFGAITVGLATTQGGQEFRSYSLRATKLLGR